jgi:hypothetical protein
MSGTMRCRPCPPPRLVAADERAAPAPWRGPPGRRLQPAGPGLESRGTRRLSFPNVRLPGCESLERLPPAPSPTHRAGMGRDPKGKHRATRRDRHRTPVRPRDRVLVAEGDCAGERPVHEGREAQGRADLAQSRGGRRALLGPPRPPAARVQGRHRRAAAGPVLRRPAWRGAHTGDVRTEQTRSIEEQLA